MTNLDSIFKSRDITLPTKVRLVKAMVFPVVMYGRDSWTIKLTEHQRIDAFKKIFIYVFLFVNVTLFIYWPHSMVCGILVPRPGMEPMPPAGEAQSLNYLTTRNVPELMLLNCGVGEDS